MKETKTIMTKPNISEKRSENNCNLNCSPLLNWQFGVIRNGKYRPCTVITDYLVPVVCVCASACGTDTNIFHLHKYTLETNEIPHLLINNNK